MRSRRSRATKRWKAVAFSCIHSPYYDLETIHWLCKIIRREKPTHVINLGDLFESAAASVHPDEHEHDQESEYAAAADAIGAIRLEAPKARLVWLLGNHDDNLRRPDKRRVAKELRSLVHWNNSRVYGDEFRLWRQIPYVKGLEGVYRLGKVRFWHGFDCGPNSDQLEALQINWVTGGDSHTLMVRGHTHRPRPPERIMRTGRVPLPYHVMNVGTLGPLKPEYAKRVDTAMWGAGAAVIEGDSRWWEARLEQPACRSSAPRS